MAKEDEMGKGTAEEQLVERYRDELANEKAAHAECERLLSETRRQIADAHAAFDKAGAITHMIGNESRGIDEQRATLAERAEDIQQARIEAERRENEARADREHVEEERNEEQAARIAAERQFGDLRRDAQEARDRLSRVKAAVDALRAAWFPISGEDAARYRDHMGAIERALAGVVSAPTITFTFGRFVSGHVQRLRDGTWEWCHDGGFDHGVIPLAPDVCAFLSSVAGPPRPALTEERAREIATLADTIEKTGRAWGRVAPGPIAQALRVIDRRMAAVESFAQGVSDHVVAIDKRTSGLMMGQERTREETSRHVIASVGAAEGVTVPAGQDPPLTEDEDREAHRFGQVTGIGFAAAKDAIRETKARRTRLHDGDPAKTSVAEIAIRPSSTPLDDERLRNTHRDIATIKDADRHLEACRRASVSFSAEDCAIWRGAKVDGDWMVWPDGERYPRRLGK